MSTEQENGTEVSTASAVTHGASTESPEQTPDENRQAESTMPPTTPCSVIWSHGRPYVLEGAGGRPRWTGRDSRGRPLMLTRAEMQRRGWSLRRAG